MRTVRQDVAFHIGAHVGEFGGEAAPDVRIVSRSASTTSVGGNPVRSWPPGNAYRCASA